MTQKEILVLQMREIRNEFTDALADLTQEQLAKKHIGDHNPIGWIACHCLNNFNFFIHYCQTKSSILSDGGVYEKLGAYGHEAPTEDNLPPDLSDLPDVVNKVFGVCIELIEALDEEDFDKPALYWHHEHYESVAGNCVRVINHSNAHLRQIWMLRGAFGDNEHWPLQTLYKKPNEEQGNFYVPDRETILANRKK
jgi:hypothetical protein